MRNIIIVNATQIITSEANPQGIFSVVSGFPKVFDSGEGGDIEATMKTAKSAYFAQLSANYGNTNPNRVMTTVTLETATGRQILHESIGGFPTDTQDEEEPIEEELNNE